MKAIHGPVSFDERKDRARQYLREFMALPRMTANLHAHLERTLNNPAAISAMAAFAQYEIESTLEGNSTTALEVTGRLFRED